MGARSTLDEQLGEVHSDTGSHFEGKTVSFEQLPAPYIRRTTLEQQQEIQHASAFTVALEEARAHGRLFRHTRKVPPAAAPPLSPLHHHYPLAAALCTMRGRPNGDRTRGVS